MARFEVRLKRSVIKDIERIAHKDDRRRIVQQIGQLADEPRPIGCQKLAGQDRYRLRHRSFRIIYSIEDALLVVQVVRVGHSKDVYRKH